MPHLTKSLVLAGLASLTLAASVAQAQAPAAAPEHTLTGNVGLFSEYIFRGIAQTAGKPALQGGFDYGHASGFYLGTWASNASWLSDFGASLLPSSPAPASFSTPTARPMSHSPALIAMIAVRRAVAPVAQTLDTL